MDDRPKYLALSGERPVRGFERAVGRKEAILCEGVFDYLTAVSWRLPAFSPCGTHLPPGHLGFLARAERVFGVFDGDAAGDEAAERFGAQLGRRWRPLRLPDGIDLNELGLRPHGRDWFLRMLGAARMEPAQVLTAEEIERVLGTFDRPTYEDFRNRALVACYIATGLRMREILDLPLSSIARVTGEIKFMRAKGNKERCAWLSTAALRHVKAYLRVRPHSPQDEKLWLLADGKPLGKWGAHSIMKQPRVRCGIVRMHWHLFRHGFAQGALLKGADMGTVQEMLGHTSNAMTRRYAGQVRQTEAARQMPKFAPI